MSEYLDYLGEVEDAKDKINDLALKMYQQGYTDALDIDMDKPMHFTPEQKAWVKKYIAINGERQRVDGAREFAEWLASSDYANGYFDTDDGFVSVEKVLAEWQKEVENG